MNATEEPNAEELTVNADNGIVDAMTILQNDETGPLGQSKSAIDRTVETIVKARNEPITRDRTMIKQPSDMKKSPMMNSNATIGFNNTVTMTDNTFMQKFDMLPSRQ